MNLIAWLLLTNGSVLAYRCFSGHWPFEHFHANARRHAQRQARKQAANTPRGLKAQLRQAIATAERDGLTAEWREDGDWQIGRHRVHLELDGGDLTGWRCSCGRPTCAHLGAALVAAA